MIRIRSSVWAHGGDFDDPLLLWYARGVGALQARPLADARSWRFMAAIHGFDEALWTRLGYFQPGEPLPAPAVRAQAWNQCQHQSWYFLPWHRGYVWSLESLVLDAIVRLGGPPDWALPYWNYSDTDEPNARQLPPAFARPTLPDGSRNPLYVTQRYGAGTTPIVLPADDVTLEALDTIRYTGTGSTSTGFGGLRTAFSHGGTYSGRLEQKPHNIVHVDIGGGTRLNPGLMSVPSIAALDPIFWLHHANIDRLWVDWIGLGGGRADPPDQDWLDGPADRAFVVPDTSGRLVKYTPAQMQDTTAAPLGYRYSASGMSAPASAHVARLARFGIDAGAARSVTTMEGRTMAELIGASTTGIALSGATTQARVALDPPGAARVQQGFARLANAAEGAAALPDRVFLALENIRGARDATVLDVYVNLPAGADPAAHPEHRAGAIGLFGLAASSDAAGAHGGSGLTETLEITAIVDRLMAAGRFDAGTVDVLLVARGGLEPDDAVSVGRIGIYREDG